MEGTAKRVVDLDFVDPPLLPGMVPYELSVAPEQASEHLQLVADELEADETLITNAAKRAARALRTADAARVYTENAAPFLARFLTIELDTENPIAKGIGRAAVNEPPPRFGEKFRRRLQKPGAMAEIAPIIDQLVFRGYATAVAANGLRHDRKPFELTLDSPIEDRWGSFLGQIFPVWGAFQDEKSYLSTLRDVVCAPADRAYLKALGTLAGLSRPGRRMRAKTYRWYFPAIGGASFYSGVTAPG